ncbi:AN1-type zinc finger protein TMC1 [Cyphellophora attinorum]|uniref:AN1-type zinc finger protein TMC1 n=1 Tax=Cyphellophora attinorum TaxID=1664694 RepID=A0A0N1P0J5_9EURO|nr:AN1-type zinc finger protein TMC1 [Phialophora attinorum]KPI43665.1 AN1-type zinc finger protein TMC1 [Phialophora attinorum]
MPSRSNSVSSQTSNKELSPNNIAINVVISDGKSESPAGDALHGHTADANNAPVAIKLNILPTHTVANLLNFLKADTTVDSNARLLMDSKPLSPASTVAELKLTSGATLSLDPPSARRSTSPTTTEAIVATDNKSTADSGTSTPATAASTPRSGTPAKKSRKPRCSKDGCNAPAQPIVGDCGYCAKRFCGKHRMLESHTCEGLADARQADKDRNTAKLEGERTVMLRGL